MAHHVVTVINLDISSKLSRVSRAYVYGRVMCFVLFSECRSVVVSFRLSVSFKTAPFA